jgi:hypothetical protein
MVPSAEMSVAEAVEFCLDRRRKPRIPLDVHARMKSVNPLTSTGPSSIARIVEISRGGLKLRAGERFMVGASVQIVAERRVFTGKVRHCQSIDGDFHIGVQLAEA